MQNKLVILGTGGTIAGRSSRAGDNVGYAAAQITAADLVAAVPGLDGAALEAEQVAQLDSKDMDHATWLRLAQRAAHHLARADVQGIVVTHGTDTLEETAWFLQRVLAPAKPVVLTAAMRPATSVLADGPQNLLDAACVARTDGAKGVVTVLAGQVLGAADVRKVHTYRPDAFSAGDAGRLGVVEEGRLRRFRDWPVSPAFGVDRLVDDAHAWPRVELLLSHAGASGALVDALAAQGVQGIVVAGTGNGSIHQSMEAALRRARDAGVAVWRTSRCVDGAVIGDGPFTSAGALPAYKARIELMLHLMAQPAA